MYNMTTLSIHSRLSGRCADLSNSCQHKIVTTQKSADNEGDGDNLVLEDEEIASVKAGGTSGIHVPDDGGPVEKQLLTAALVTSIVEFAGTSPCSRGSSSRKNAGHVSGTKGFGMETRRRSLRKRQPSEGSDERERADNKESLLKSSSSFPHVTPPTSGSSSFSSVETVEKTQNTKQSRKSGRTVNKRVSKSATSEKVASVLASHRKTIIEVAKASAPETKKRKLNLNVASTAQSSNVVSSLEQAIASNPHTPKSAVLLLCTSVTGKSGMLKPQPIFNYNEFFSTPAVKNKGVSLGSDLWNLAEKKSEEKAIRAKAAQGKHSPSLLPMNRRGTKLNTSLVPNPLAGTQESTFNVHSSLFPILNFKRQGVTKKTSTLMSAAPDAFVPDSNPPSKNGSAVKLVGQLADIAESMSSQHYQTDGLAASSVNEVALPERGRIFSIDLDRE